MNGGGVGKGQFLQLTYVIHHFPSIKIHGQFPLFHVHMIYDTYVTIENFLIIVVADLHDFIMEPVLRATSAQENAARIHGLLQHLIQVRRPTDASLHGRQHLNILQGIHMIIARQIFGAVFHQKLHHLFIGLFRGKKEIRVPAAPHVDLLPFVDAVGIHDDTAAPGLPEDPA